MTTFPLNAIYTWYSNLVSNPKYRWWVIAGTLMYLVSPLDIIPDFIPFIGEIDDAVVVTLLATEVIQVFKDRNAAVKQKQTTQAAASATATTVDVKAVEVV
jgi:uncharacterized membrane protein YkvA (DUF1232 family)